MSTVHLQTLFDYLNEGLMSAAIVLGGFALRFLAAWLSTHMSFVNQKTKDAMLSIAEQAMQHGGEYAMKLLQTEEAKHEAINFPGGVKGWTTCTYQTS